MYAGGGAVGYAAALADGVGAAGSRAAVVVLVLVGIATLAVGTVAIMLVTVGGRPSGQGGVRAGHGIAARVAQAVAGFIVMVGELHAISGAANLAIAVVPPGCAGVPHPSHTACARQVAVPP